MQGICTRIHPIVRAIFFALMLLPLSEQPTVEASNSPIIRRFEGHTDWVLDAAFSPDGQTALSASSDHTLILWDIATGEPMRSLVGHADFVSSVAISPDGETALSGSCAVEVDNVCPNTELILWDVGTGEPLRRLEGDAGWITSIAFSPDGQIALSSSTAGTILWDVATGERLHTFEDEPSTALNIAFSPDGRSAYAAYATDALFVWELEPVAIRHRFDKRIAPVESVAFTADASMALFAYSSDEDADFLMLWDTMTGFTVREFEGDIDEITSVALSPNAETFLTGTYAGTLALWDVTSGEIIWRFTEHESIVKSIAFSPDGQTALSTSIDGMILWDVTTD